MNEFFTEVYAVVAEIQYGKVATYGQIAMLAGRPRCARMVGTAMKNCPEGLPWHRVVRSNGEIASGVSFDECRQRLLAEGVTFKRNGHIDMAAHQWDVFFLFK